jgi:hypothetical protein
MKYWLHPGPRITFGMQPSFIASALIPVSHNLLLAEFERLVELLLLHPGLGTLWLNGRRRLLMKRFPYSLIYTTES